jgi:multidrug efflux pump subunit AcrA (membrane-fusion protein)
MRTLSIAAALAASVSLAHAQSPSQSPEVLAKVYACAGIAEGSERLACFDAAVAALKQAEGQGQFAAVDADRVQQIEREAFGFSLPSLPRLGLPGFRREGGAVERTAELAMTIKRVGRFDGRPAYIMQNGQIWAAVDSETNRNAKPGAAVTVKRASLGSFLMSFERGGAALRVRRVE